MNIRLVYTGRSYQIAETLPEELTLDEGASVADALRVVNQHLSGSTPLPPTCLVTVAGEHLGSVAQFADRLLRDGEELVLIAPVAGG